jgi:beta-galactosidase
LNTQNGTLTSFRYQNHELLTTGPRFNIWRAPTDNDGIKLRENQCWKPLGRWQAIGLDRLKTTTEKATVQTQKKGTLTFTVHQIALPFRAAYGFDIRTETSILSTGDIHITNTIHADHRLPDIPRIGTTMTLRPGLEQFSYFGRGPHENYWDRKRGAALGYYQSTVTDQYIPYIMPQEHGNHTDIRWLTLKSNTHGLLVVPDTPMECTASHFTTDDLANAYHTSDLEPREEIILNLDIHQRGLGGASCGPDTLEQYRIQPGTFSFGYRLRPYIIGQENPHELSRQKMSI